MDVGSELHQTLALNPLNPEPSSLIPVPLILVPPPCFQPFVRSSSVITPTKTSTLSNGNALYIDAL